MNLRRWLLVGGAAVLGAAALMAPAGSSAYSGNDRYEGEINNNQAGSTVLATRVGSGALAVCTVNTGQTVGVVSVNGGQRATNATTINYTATTTGAATNSSTSGTLANYGDSSIAGWVVPCDATGVSVTFDPVCADETKCDNDTVTGGLTKAYAG